MKKPTLYYDPEADVLHLLVREGDEARFIEVAEDVNVELDERGLLLGIEILNASRLMAQVMATRVTEPVPA